MATFMVDNLIISGVTIPGVIARGTRYAYFLTQEPDMFRETYSIIDMETGNILSTGWFYHQTCEDMIVIASRARLAVAV